MKLLTTFVDMHGNRHGPMSITLHESVEELSIEGHVVWRNGKLVNQQTLEVKPDGTIVGTLPCGHPYGMFNPAFSNVPAHCLTCYQQHLERRKARVPIVGALTFSREYYDKNLRDSVRDGDSFTMVFGDGVVHVMRPTRVRFDTDDGGGAVVTVDAREELP